MGLENQTSQQTATITITGENDTATIEGDATGNVVEDTAVTDGQLTANGTLSVSDVDTGQALFSTLVTDQVGNLGSLVITEVGVWSYALDNSLPAVQQFGCRIYANGTHSPSNHSMVPRLKTLRLRLLA